jgi:simple sugar transport system permease protein
MATTTAEPTPAPQHERLRRISLGQRLLAKPAAGALVIVVFVWVVFAVLSTARGNTAFLSIPGTLGYLDVAAQVGIIGTAVALLMIAGEFDLSVGSMVGFAGIVIGICATIYGLPIWLSIVVAMVLTTCLGAINGFIVVRTGLPSFIVTLATLFIIAGLSSVLTSLVTNITYIPHRGRSTGRPLHLEAVVQVRRPDHGLPGLPDLVGGHRCRRCLRPRPASLR